MNPRGTETRRLSQSEPPALASTKCVNTSDMIVIRELEVWYRVGVPEEERASPQRLLLTIEMIHDFEAASATDDLRIEFLRDGGGKKILLRCSRHYR